MDTPQTPQTTSPTSVQPLGNPAPAAPVASSVPPVQPTQPLSSARSASSPTDVGGPVPRKRFPVLLGTVVLLFLLLGGAAFAFKYVQKPAIAPEASPITAIETPVATTDPTEGWKTYTNTSWNYKVKYPADQYVDCSSGNDEGIRLWKVPFDCPTGHDTFYEVGIINNAPGLYKENKVPSKVETIQVGGKTATKKTYIYDESDGPLLSLGQSTEIVIETDKGIIQIQAFGASASQLDQILSTFEFTQSASSTPTSTSQTERGGLGGIQYSLPATWKSDVNAERIMLSANGGGYLSISSYEYAHGTDVKQYFCQVKNVCQDSTYYTAMQIGNISGYRADSLDNSGGGPIYFGTKGSVFYVIDSYNPPSPNEYEKTYQQVLDSLKF